MNRLILIGNGFDLAHGLKTRYNDFILDYFKDVIVKCIQGVKYSKIGDAGEYYYYKDELIELKSKTGFKFSENIIISELNKINEVDKLIQFAQNKSLNFKYNFSLLESTIDEFCNQNWIDIEVLYFEHLMHLKQKKEEGSIADFNAKFEFLREKLNNYLLKAQFQINTPFTNNFTSLIHQFNDIFNWSPDLRTESEGEKMILNFNYTNTLELYRNVVGLYKIKINYIHENINQSKNKIVFGFGDEHDEEYRLLEKEKDKNYFKHIKSLHYFKNSNYRLLSVFINDVDFEVFVLGHSCSISDRTLLKEIFEHDKCKSIRIYYHIKDDKSTDYDDKIIDIMRHFSDKISMRNKIITFDLSLPMPQLIK